MPNFRLIRAAVKPAKRHEHTDQGAQNGFVDFFEKEEIHDFEKVKDSN